MHSTTRAWLREDIGKKAQDGYFRASGHEGNLAGAIIHLLHLSDEGEGRAWHVRWLSWHAGFHTGAVSVWYPYAMGEALEVMSVLAAASASLRLWPISIDDRRMFVGPLVCPLLDYSLIRSAGCD